MIGSDWVWVRRHERVGGWTGGLVAQSVSFAALAVPCGGRCLRQPLLETFFGVGITLPPLSRNGERGGDSGEGVNVVAFLV